MNLDDEHDQTLAAIAALDDLDARAAALYRPGDEIDPAPSAFDDAPRLRAALLEARTWHRTQAEVCRISSRPATEFAHRRRIAAIDQVLG